MRRDRRLAVLLAATLLSAAGCYLGSAGVSLDGGQRDADPSTGDGGAVSGLPMAIVIAVSSAAALAVFAAVATRTRTLTPILDTPEEASADMPVG